MTDKPGVWQPPRGPVPVPPGGRATDEDLARLEEAAKFWDDPIVRALVVYKTRLDRGELTDEEADAYECEIDDAMTRRMRKWRGAPWRGGSQAALRWPPPPPDSPGGFDKARTTPPEL